VSTTTPSTTPVPTTKPATTITTTKAATTTTTEAVIVPLIESVLPPSEGCTADIQFVIDASTSVCDDNFEHSKEFIRHISATFDWKTTKVRMGVLTYSSRKKLNIIITHQ